VDSFFVVATEFRATNLGLPRQGGRFLQLEKPEAPDRIQILNGLG
jgi:hypothetical protein